MLLERGGEFGSPGVNNSSPVGDCSPITSVLLLTLLFETEAGVWVARSAGDIVGGVATKEEEGDPPGGGGSSDE